MIHEFKTGRSGSTVALIAYGNSTAIHKTNVRNAEKVVELMRNSPLPTPEVYEYTHSSITLEYIPGIPMRKHIYTMNKCELDRTIGILRDYISDCLSKSTPYDYSAEIAAKELSTGYQARITDPVFPKYNIHGDLTIDNLLCYEGKIYFIDYNYTELDSIYFDVNKLRQDLDGLWFARNNPPNVTVKMNLNYIKRHLDCAFPGMFRDDLYRFQLSRILPYVSGEEHEFIMREIKRCE